MSKLNRLIPVLFQKIKEFKTEDTRFTKVKIWLMHLGQNHNGSYFLKEVVENAIPTLANTPILAYIEKNSQDEDDFSDHRRKMTRDSKGTWNYKYYGQAYGVIPETNNAKFEYRLCDDGVEREFLTVEGLVWTKWDDPVDILNRDVVKNQSMELHDDMEGYLDEKDNLFHFTSFKFFGACMMGLDQLPAMQNSTTELLQFSFEDVSKQIQEKMEEYKNFQAINKGGQGMNEKLKLLAKFSKTAEELGIDLEKVSYEDLKTKLDTMENSTESEESQEESQKEDKQDFNQDNSDETTMSDNSKKNFVKTFELSHDDIRTFLYAILNSEEENWHWIAEVYDDYFIYNDGNSNLYYKQAYNRVENQVTLVGEKVEVFSMFLTQIELDALNALKTNYTQLESEVDGLKKIINDYATRDRENDEVKLFEQYKALDGIADFENIKKNSAQFSSIVDMEKEIALVFVRNQTSVNFSKTNKEDEQRNRFNFEDENKKVSKYGDLFDRFGNKK